MDIGLYQLKYPVRRLIAGVLPLMRNVRPDAVSWSILPVGIATALCYLKADHHPALLIVGPVLILLRMFLATLDGLMAVTFGKTSARGEIANRVPGEISDALLILAIAQSPGRMFIGAAALAICWITTFAGLVGLTAGRPVQSVGPAGQTDRLAVLIAFSLVGFVLRVMGHPLDVLLGFLWWVLIGGTVTIVLRLWRTLRSCPS
jgi:phosphatidylglycerophosphate synthase